jgi:hypothetical protein
MGGIVIDGYGSDWEELNVKPSITDPQGDNIGSVPGTDIKRVRVSMDDKNLYLMLELHDRIDVGIRVEYCFAIDVNGDGKWDYQPGFDAYGNAWIWNLTGGRDYSDQRNVSPLEAEVGVADVIEFKMALNLIGRPMKMTLAPYFVIKQADKYVVADKTDPIEVTRLSHELPRTTVPILHEQASEAWKLIREAQDAIDRARTEGGNRGLKEAESELMMARDSWKWGKWQEAASHARQAMNLAYSATGTPSQEQLGVPSWTWPSLAAVAIAAAIAITLITGKHRKKSLTVSTSKEAA